MVFNTLAISVIIVSLVGILFSSLFSVFFIHLYAKYHQVDEKPIGKFSDLELPSVTIQLPIYNEELVVERLIRSSAAIAYPHKKLQIQVIDDSTDNTSAIVQEVIQSLKRTFPQIDFQHLRRPNRKGWKAGALEYGLEKASGDFIAIFDADFIIQKDFLRKTIHYFTDPGIGLVQARWAFVNRDYSLLTSTQASKLDSHQMFEQTARYWSGRWIHFHGTAGVWRKATIESAGGWHFDTDVEDIDLSIRAAFKGWRFIYLNDLKVMSELPISMGAYLLQQRRWKRGWLQVLQKYWVVILKSKQPLWVRLDIIQRLANSYSTLLSLVITTAALPAFVISKQLGLHWLIFTLYSLLLVTSLTLRIYERIADRKVMESNPEPSEFKTNTLKDIIHNCIPFRYLLDVGTLSAWTIGSLEAFAGKSKFERTPKTGVVGSKSRRRIMNTGAFINLEKVRQFTLYSPKYRLISLGNLALFCLATICLYYSLIGHNFLSAFFYSLQIIGTGWVFLSLWSES